MQSSLMPRVDIVSNEGAPGGTDSGWFTPSPSQSHSKLIITESLEHVILSDSRKGRLVHPRPCERLELPSGGVLLTQNFL